MLVTRGNFMKKGYGIIKMRKIGKVPTEGIDLSDVEELMEEDSSEWGEDVTSELMPSELVFLIAESSEVEELESTDQLAKVVLDALIEASEGEWG